MNLLITLLPNLADQGGIFFDFVGAYMIGRLFHIYWGEDRIRILLCRKRSSSISTGGESLGQPGDSSSPEVDLDLGDLLDEESDKQSSPRSKEHSNSSHCEDGRSPSRTADSSVQSRRSKS